ncbi:MAG TPA: peptidoglycan-binding domain-containing protein [Terracidiphilus sp.]|nr:peptidoglycan-binding domain-containing protein [Terracidiphilus sp.]
MVLLRASLAFILTASLCTSQAVAARTHHSKKTSSHHSTSHTTAAHTTRVSATTRRHHSSRRSHHVRGQQAIQPERVTQIQQALIREHYMSGDANGDWDSATQAAMQKYQSDHGWQTKLMPDSRALVSLGLGPDYSDAINAGSGNFNPPPPVSSIPSAQAAGFASAAHVDREN